jgi:anthranilate synthase component 1
VTELEVQRLASQGYGRIPVLAEARADLYTPLALYAQLANGPYSYLLESVVGGERFGRYSFIGLAAAKRIEVRGYDCAEIENGRTVRTTTAEDPLAFVQDYLDRFRTAEDPRLPRFCGGLVGYFGYEIVRYIEKRLARAAKPDPLGVPDIVLLVSEEIAIVDNLSGKLSLVVYASPDEADAYGRARERLAELLKKLRAPVQIPPDTHGASEPAVSGFGQRAYHAAVDKAKRYIYDGDVMQVVPSQRMSKPFRATPLALYRALRTLNPSPYMFYFDLRDFHIVGASPEILVRLEGENVTVRPIAGTRRRGATAEEDAALADVLLADE